MYRIGVINDFRGSTAVIEYKQFGIMKSLQSWICSSKNFPHKKSIGVFLNYQQILDTHSKDEAWGLVQKLISEAPTDLSEESHYLKTAIFG